MEMFRPLRSFGENDVIHVWVAKWSMWSPIPMRRRRANQNQKDFQTGNSKSETATMIPPMMIIGL